MRIVERILTKNPCYTAGKKISVKGLMLHSVGCPQPSALVFINSWDNPSFNSACVHGFIDGNDGTVYQTLPWDHRGWHGGGSSNNTHIGIEMCEPSCIKYTKGATFTCSDIKAAKEVAERTYMAAAELFAMLCEKFKLDPLADGVILSHKEGCKRGIASNHGDPEHLWMQLGTGYTMDTFRKAVKEKMKESEKAEKTITYRVRKSWEDSKSQKGAYKVLENAVGCADRNPGYFVFDEEGQKIYPLEEKSNVPFRIKVSVTDLNIRKGPGIDFIKTGRVTGIGVFTIVETAQGKGSKAGWGRLKSGGWISLDYCKRI